MNGDEIHFVRESFVKSVDELIQLLVPMMELSKWLQAPSGTKPTLELPG